MQKLFQDEMAAAEQANGAASSQQQSIVRMTRSGLAIPYTEIPAPRLLRDYAGLVETAFTCIPDPTASLEQLQQQQQEQQQQWESSPPSSFERQTATYKGLTATYHRGQTSAFEEQRVTYGWPTTTTSEAQTGSYTSEAATYEWPTSTSEGQTATYTSETATNEAQTITSEGQTATYTSQTASYEDQSTSVSTHHSQTRPQQLTWLTDITTQDSAIGTVDNASINTSASYQSDAGSLLSLRPYPSPLAIRRDTFNLPSPSLSPEEETQPFTGPEILVSPVELSVHLARAILLLMVLQ